MLQGADPPPTTRRARSAQRLPGGPRHHLPHGPQGHRETPPGSVLSYAAGPARLSTVHAAFQPGAFVDAAGDARIRLKCRSFPPTPAVRPARTIKHAQQTAAA